MSKLEADLLLLEMKSRNTLSDMGFDDLLGVMEKLLPSPNKLPRNAYVAKQMICPIGLNVHKIYACPCPKDCVLYCGDLQRSKSICPFSVPQRLCLASATIYIYRL